jgi:GcrA cell cycle regulator
MGVADRGVRVSLKHLGNTSAGKWEPAHDAALRRRKDEGFSAAGAASAINDEFGTRYSRNAAIGRMKRLGMCETMAALNHRKSIAAPKPKVRRVQKYKPRPKGAPEPVDPVEMMLRCAAVEPRNVGLLELGDGECRYPYGDGPYLFCGHQALVDHPYCRPHFQLCRGAPR